MLTCPSCGQQLSATWDEFERLQLAVGRIVEVEDLVGARRPAYKPRIDFGPRGERSSSAHFKHYSREELVGRRVVAVLGFEPKRVAGFKSEALVIGALSEPHGVVLLQPDRDVEDGAPIG